MAEMTAGPAAVWAFAEHEHRELTRGINRIHDIGCDIPGWVSIELSTHLLGILDWFDHVVDPHLFWEEASLYPEVDARAGTPWATRSARFDHSQIRAMVARLRLDSWSMHSDGASALLPEVRCHLFGLEALLRSHIEREERFLMPLLAEESARPQPPAAVGSR